MPGSRPPVAKAARPRSSRRSAVERGRPRALSDFLVVGIGASAGGLEACRKLLAALPAGMRHGLHPRPASRSDPRKHDGGSAGRPHVDDRAAGGGWHADRARPPLCHSARNLSFRRRRRPASFAAPGASRRAPAVRFPAAFAGGRVRRARRLRDPFGNRRRRQPRAESREGKRRARHRAGPRRGRLRRHAAERDHDGRRGPCACRSPKFRRRSSNTTGEWRFVARR